MGLPRSHENVRRHERYTRSNRVLSSGAQNWRSGEYNTSFHIVLLYLRFDRWESRTLEAVRWAHQDIFLPTRDKLQPHIVPFPRNFLETSTRPTCMAMGTAGEPFPPDSRRRRLHGLECSS